MSWAASLCALYDANAWRAGNVENWNGKPLVLMPLGYDTMKAQIEVIIDGDGNFISARTLDKSEAETIVPYPYRRNSGVKALPLCDSLSYIAGDFLERITMFLDGETEKKKVRTIHDIKNSFPSYINGLSEWCSSDFVTTKVMAVYKYVLRKSVIADLQKSGVLLPDDDGLLSDRKKILGVRIEKAFVRFRVYEKNVHQEETAIWLDKETQQCFIKYYLSTAKNKDLCYFRGNIELTAKTNPVKIRGEWPLFVSPSLRLNAGMTRCGIGSSSIRSIWLNCCPLKPWGYGKARVRISGRNIIRRFIISWWPAPGSSNLPKPIRIAGSEQ